MESKNEPVVELTGSDLAKEMKINRNDIFQKLTEIGFITRNGRNWDLTIMGKSKGGTYKNSSRFGRYIVWPRSIIIELENSNHDDEKTTMLTATSIGQHYQISATRVNSILSELGWIKKDSIKGWHLTNLGQMLGGLESKYITTGVSYIRWPTNIINNKILFSNIRQVTGEVFQPKENESDSILKSDTSEFREKYKAEHRAKDGHYVRSKAELIIDNTLYDYKIVHAYERKLPVEEDVYCDFYIPTGKVYIEYWGLSEEKYLVNKKRKLEVYSKYNFNLIQLHEKDVSNLEDILPAKLLDFGIGVE